MRRFIGRRIVVTGAGHGIGRAAAMRFAAEGGRMAVLSKEESAAQAVAAAIQAAGGEAYPFAGDFRRPGVARSLLEAAMTTLGGVDVLVNNAGWTRTQPFLEDDDAYWEEIVRLNLMAVLEACQVALRRMVADGGGVIVNVSSDAGRVGMAGEACYAAAKGGVIALTKSIAQEMARHGIRANVVAPGPTNTRVLEENLAAAQVEKMLRRIPLRRAAEPEEVAEAILFLASDQASVITGQVLSVSGGLTMV